MWDTYRTQMPLVALIDPSQASDMVTSILNDAAQGGWLPRWPVANSYTATQSGDSADPLIAAAYAFGARNFDTNEALKAMVHGAQDPAPLSSAEDKMFESDSLIRYEERPGLVDYESLHYVRNFMFRQSSGTADGASTTLEYATDDAAIGFFAKALGRQDVASQFLTRAQNWKYMFNAATGYVEPRGESGSFPAGAPVQPPPPQPPPYPADQIYFGQNGFQEGNAAQYTWMVPFDVAGLINALGGRASANARLDAFFDRNADPYGFGQAGANAPYFWAGNEPDLQTPWLYDFTGKPWKTQRLVREIEDTFYTPTPGGEPGNDDLGTMASWYVWAALGLYPEIPGDGTVVLGSPLFPRVEIKVPGEGTLDIDAPAASDSSPYVQAVALNGQPVNASWLSVGALMPGATGGTPAQTVLSFDLGPSPDTTWASDPTEAPPSYGVASASGIGGATAIGFSSPWGQLVASPESPTQLEIGARNVSGVAQTVHWRALAPPGVSISPSHGVIHLPGGLASATETVSVDVAVGGSCRYLTLDFSTAQGQQLPGVVIALSPSSDVECGAPSELGGNGESLATTIESIVKRGR
jgi:putative alpha-1,2-mannosidase